MATTHTSFSLVCFRKVNAEVVGTGFLVDEQHILTCAHVVAEAIELPGGEFSPDPPQELVHLDFPLIDHNAILTARVVFWQPAREDWSGGDIAGLQLMSDAPAGAEAVHFALAEDVWDHDFRVFGFPRLQDNGVWATGRLLDRQASNWIQIEDNKIGGFSVIPGFSGGAVWDEQLEGVVGMVVASIVQPETRGAFVIPQDVLLTAWSLIKPTTHQRVFISAAPADATHAERLRADLEASGILVWDEQHGPAGRSASVERVRQQGIRAAQALVVIVSPQTAASLTVREHLHLAELYQRRSIFVWMGEAERSQEPGGWRDIMWVDAHGSNYATGLQAIGATLRERTSITGLLDTLNEPEWEPRNPYIGLHAFTEKEAKDFFGRQRFIEQLCSDVQQMLKAEPGTNEQRRLLTVIGASGSGKSSVILAGLLPQLKQREESKFWVYLTPMVPGRDPVAALVDTLSPHFPDTSFKTQRENLEGDTTNGLHRLAKQLATQQERITHQNTCVVLFVDQFEELFTQTVSEEHRRRFLEVLQTAVIEPGGPLLVLLTMRADFYHRLMDYPEFYKLIEPTLKPLLPLSIDELRETIERPAAQPDVQIFFEGNLVGDLLFEVLGQTGALPLLQFTLQQLFERRNGHRLTQQAYKDIGKVSGALAKYADETYERLPKEQQPLARVLFLRLLEAGVSEQVATRRRAPINEFAFDDPGQSRLMQETMQVFVAARLLTTNANESTGTTTIEVSHEALIRAWPLLVGWLREARDVIPLQQAVSKDVEEWEHYRKPKDRLYRGTQLKEAQTWAARYMVSGREMAFLRASERQQQRSFQLRLTIIFLILILMIPVVLLGVPQLIMFAQQNNLYPITVTSLQDTGPGSLTSAIQAASQKNSTIYFDAGLKGKTIVLTNNLILEKSLTLNGPGVTISSGDHDYQISVNALYTVTIEGLGFKQGMIKGNHFIHNYGTLVLDHTTFSGINKTASHINLIYNDRGQLTISNSTISGNNITGPNSAIIYNDRGQLTISSNTTITNNIGEIYNTGGQMTITNSTIKNMNRNNPNKTKDGSPSAFYNDTDGSLTIRDSTIADNISYYNGGGIYNGGMLTISGSTISGNSFLSNPGSEATKNGGGIANDIGAILTISNSTIAGNAAGHSGGGIANWGKMFMSFCTIYGNSARAGGGIAVLLNGSVQMSNSIVVGNNLIIGKQPSQANIAGELISKGFNLIQNMAHIALPHTSASDTSNIAVSRFTTDQDKAVSVDDVPKFIDPQGLQNNGGLTRTYKLLSSQSNPAVDKIPMAACDIPNIFDSVKHKYIDQRGATRPDDNEQFCDAGAYESSG